MLSDSLEVTFQSSCTKKLVSMDLLATAGTSPSTLSLSGKLINIEVKSLPSSMPLAPLPPSTFCAVMPSPKKKPPAVLLGWKKLFRKMRRSPPNLMMCLRKFFVICELNDHWVSVSLVTVQQASTFRPWQPSSNAIDGNAGRWQNVLSMRLLGNP